MVCMKSIDLFRVFGVKHTLPVRFAALLLRFSEFLLASRGKAQWRLPRKA